MIIFTAIICNIFLFLSYLVYTKMRGMRFFQLDLWTSIFLFALLPTVFGANTYLFGGYELSWGLQDYIDKEVIHRVYIEYYASWCILLLIFGLGSSYITLPDMLEENKKWDLVNNKKLFDLGIFILFITIILYDLLLIGDLPFFYILSGDIIGAEEAKGKFFEVRMTSGIPFIGYLMQYYPLFTFGWFFQRLMSGGRSFYLIITSLVLIIYSILTIIKGYALLGFIIGFLIFFSYSKNRINIPLILKFSLVFVIVIFPVFAVLESESYKAVFFNIYERIFLVQIQGAFLIRSNFDGIEMSALMEGMPLAGRLGFETMDPAAKVLEKIWGEQAFLDGFVNINSHFIGQGYVMFGSLIPLIGPIIIYINAFLLTLLYRVSSSTQFSSISRIILITCAALIPINNNFGNTVYLKSLLGFTFLTLAIMPIYLFSKKIKKIR